MSMDKEILMRFVSEQGYKKNSPDKDRPMNIIPSGNITMKDVEFPVFGVDNLGNSQMMYPGAEYQFPGNMVMELPMKQDAGIVTEVPPTTPSPVGGRQYVGKYNLQGEFIPYNYRYASYTENPDIQDEQGNTGYFAQFSKPVGSKTDFGNYKFAATESDSAYYESNPTEGISTIFIPEGEDDPYASNPMWQQSSYQGDAKIKEKFNKRLSKLQEGGNNNILTYKDNSDWFDSRAIYWHGNDPEGKYNNMIREKVYSGKYGYNPKSGQIIPLNEKNQIEVSQEIKDIRNLEKEQRAERDKVRSMSPEDQRKYQSDKFHKGMIEQDKRPIYVDDIMADYVGKPAGSYTYMSPEELEVYNDEYAKRGLKKTIMAGRDIIASAPGIETIADAVGLVESTMRGDEGDMAIYSAGLALPFVPATAIKKGKKFLGLADDVPTGSTLKDDVAQNTGTLDIEKPKVTTYDQVPKHLDDLKKTGKYWDDQGAIGSELLHSDMIEYVGTYGGRPIVQVKMPDGSTQSFYKSSGWAGKKGSGVDGTTEGMWQPFGGFSNRPGSQGSWFIKDGGYETFYDSQTFRDMAGNMDIALANKYGFNSIDELDNAFNFQNRNSTVDSYIPEYQQGGMTVSQTWKQKTGTPWSEAKAQGYTTGSYQDNIDLLNRLNSGEFDQTPTVSNDTSGVVTVPDTATEEVNFDNHVDFASAFKDARNQFGSNHIFTYQGKRYTTNTASEPFTPNKDQISNEQNRTGNSEVRVRKNLDLQAKKAGSPYHSKNDLDTETKVWEDWNTVKSDQLETNKMGNADVIVEYHKNNPSDKNFVIVDKSKGLMHMYKPDGTLLFTDAFDIDVGANPGDAQTVTKYKDLNNNSITDSDEVRRDNVDWGAGNMSTGAGKYYISNIDPKGYGGLPLLNMMNENQYAEYLKTGDVNQVSTSFHKGYVADDNNRVSNGCIRCNRPTLEALTGNLQNTSEVYILPEDKGNRFVIENNKLNFRVGSGKDYEQYTDSEGNVQSGQGINRTTETLNYIPIKININEEALKEQGTKYWSGGWDQKQYRERIQPFVTTLQTDKKEIMKAAQISGDVYNDLVGITLGIFGTETNYGDQNSGFFNLLRAGQKFFDSDASSPDYKSKYETYGADADNNSVGLTQIRWAQLNDHEKEVLAELGITSNKDFLDPRLSSKATIAILGVRYNEQLTPEEKQDPWTHLPGKWNNRGNYADRVKTNASFFNVQQVTPEGEVILKDLNENRKKVLSKMDPIYPEVNQTISTRDIQKPIVEEYLTPAERKTKYINTLSRRFGIPPSQVTDQMIDKYLASIGLTRDMVEKERGGTVDPTEVFDEEMKLDKKFKPGGLTYDKTKAIYETRKLLSLLT